MEDTCLEYLVEHQDIKFNENFRFDSLNDVIPHENVFMLLIGLPHQSPG